MTTPAAPVPAAPAVTPKPVVPANGAAKNVPQPPAKPPVKPGAAPPAAAGAPPAAEGADADPIVWEGKVDGQHRKVRKSEADRYIGKGAFADKTTQEAKEAIKRAKAAAEQVQAERAAFAERLKTDLAGVLKEHGIEFDDAAMARLDQKVAEGKMTPEQKRARELEDENKRLKADQEKAEKQRQAEQQKQLTSQLQRRIETSLVDAAKRANMSMGEESFYAIYESFREAFELGLLPLDANGLPPQYADRIVEDAQERLGGAQTKLRENALKLKGDALLEFVGDEAARAIAAALVEKIRAARGGGTARPAAQPAPAAPAARPSSYMTPREADAVLKKVAGGG